MIAAIEADSLEKNYGRGRKQTAALTEFSFAVEPGEAVALLGVNGAGKSTTVRILSTVVKPSGGQARILGHDVVGEPSRVRELIGVCQQEPSLPLGSRVRELLCLHARLLGLNRTAAARRTHEILEFAELGGAAGARVRQLSGGMRRRLDIGLMLLRPPPVLLLDEPTDSLDPRSRQKFWDEFGRMRDNGTCILLASHDVEETECLADRVIVISGGALQRDDLPPGEVREVWRDDGAIDAR